ARTGRRRRRTSGWGPRGPPAWSLGDQDRPSRARPGGGTGPRQALRKGRTRRVVAIGPDRVLWYLTCEGDGKDLGQLVRAYHRRYHHASRIHHHRTGRDTRPPPGLR